MKNALFLLGAAGLSTMFATGAAFAYPASVTGFYFGSANTNAGQNISFDISTQGTVGACQQVVGTFGNDNISGFYCPTTGEISFLRSTSDLGITYQVFDGQLSDVAQNGSFNISGVFQSFAGGNNNGAFPFTASPIAFK